MIKRKIKLYTVLLSVVLSFSILEGCAKNVKESGGRQTTITAAENTGDSNKDKQSDNNSKAVQKENNSPTTTPTSTATAPANNPAKMQSGTTSTTTTKPTPAVKQPSATPAPAPAPKPAPAPAPVVQTTAAPAVKQIESQPISQPIQTQPTATVTAADDFYTVVSANLEQAKDTTIVVSSDIINKGVGKMAIDAAEKSGFGGYVSSVQYSLQGTTAFIHFEYKGGKDTFLTKFNAVKASVNNIVSTVVKADMTDFQKEIALHDYVVNNTKYNYTALKAGNVPDDSYTAYGVFTQGTAVCSGYAEAMYRLLNKAGIKTLMVSGTADGVAHAWNIVSIGGSYYQLDATFDDPVSQSGDVLSYDYFNVTDAQLSKNHVWNKGDYPACTATTYNYYTANNILAGSFDEFYSIVKNGLSQKLAIVRVKTATFDQTKYPPDIIYTVYNKTPELNYLDLSNGYSYSYDPDSSVYEFYMKYK